MLELTLKTLPIIFGILSLFCNTKTKMVAVNFLTAASWVFAFGVDGAWAGVLVSIISGSSSLYTAIYNRVLSASHVISIIAVMLILIVIINLYTGSFNITSYLPLFAFAIYRYGELGMKEYGYRICSITGGFIYIAYASTAQSWGIVASELLFVTANIFYLIRSHQQKKPLSKARVNTTAHHFK